MTRARTIANFGDGLVTADLPAGSVLQVVQAVKTDTQVFSSSSYTDITGLSLNITPSSTNSRIFLYGVVTLNPDTSNHTAIWRFVKNGAGVGVGPGVSNRKDSTATSNMTGSGDHPFTIGSFFVDSPSTTSQITYKIQAATESGVQTGINYNSGADLDSSDPKYARFISNLVAMEIAG